MEKTIKSSLFDSNESRKGFFEERQERKMAAKIVYNHKAVEQKWRENWAKTPVNPQTNEDGSKKQKYYCLDMFPYPSGNGLHVGHWRGYVISDVWSRYK